MTVDSRSHEFQFKVLHRYLATNKFLHKIGLVPSSLCTFCEREGESIEHLLIECDYSNKFWQDLINWFNMIDIKVEALSESDKIFGLWKRKVDFHLLKSFCLRDRGRLGNEGRPILLKIGTQSRYVNLGNMPKFQLPRPFFSRVLDISPSGVPRG